MHVPLSPSSKFGTGQGAAGKVTVCLASQWPVAMCHTLQWFIHLWAHGLRKEMSTPPTLLIGYGTHLPLVNSVCAVVVVSGKIIRTVTCCVVCDSVHVGKHTNVSSL